LDFALRAHQLRGFAPAARASSSLGDFARRDYSQEWWFEDGRVFPAVGEGLAPPAPRRSAG
jgi:hypothetical protein